MEKFCSNQQARRIKPNRIQFRQKIFILYATRCNNLPFSLRTGMAPAVDMIGAFPLLILSVVSNIFSQFTEKREEKEKEIKNQCYINHEFNSFR